MGARYVLAFRAHLLDTHESVPTWADDLLLSMYRHAREVRTLTVR